LRQLAVAFALLVIPQLGHTFQLEEHDRITMQAYREFIACHPEVAKQVDVGDLIQSNEGEDLDLVQKELFFSHYFNPFKTLSMWRGTSMDRVQALLPRIRECRGRAEDAAEQWSIMGQIIHHMQDMTVPAHVVPVRHSFWDGFESVRYGGDISSGWSCQEMDQQAAADLPALLRGVAKQTLQSIRNWRPGVTFWLESADDGFGSYGEAGNNFGVSDFVTDAGNSMHVAAAEYRGYKQTQMRLAVRATLQALGWSLR
jgi:hypothetical protein